MSKTRLSDYVRAEHSGEGVNISQRGQVGSAHRFGDTGSVTLDAEEARALRDVLVEEYGAKEADVADDALSLVRQAREMLPDPNTDSERLRHAHDALCEAAVELERAAED